MEDTPEVINARKVLQAIFESQCIGWKLVHGEPPKPSGYAVFHVVSMSILNSYFYFDQSVNLIGGINSLKYRGLIRRKQLGKDYLNGFLMSPNGHYIFVETDGDKNPGQMWISIKEPGIENHDPKQFRRICTIHDFDTYSRMYGYVLSGDWEAFLNSKQQPNSGIPNQRTDWSAEIVLYKDFLSNRSRDMGAKAAFDSFIRMHKDNRIISVLDESDKQRFYESIRKKHARFWKETH